MVLPLGDRCSKRELSPQTVCAKLPYLLEIPADVSLGKFLKTLSSDLRRQRSLPLQVGETQTKILMLLRDRVLQTTRSPVSRVIAATLETDIRETGRDQNGTGRDLVTQDQGLLPIGEA